MASYWAHPEATESSGRAEAPKHRRLRKGRPVAWLGVGSQEYVDGDDDLGKQTRQHRGSVVTRILEESDWLSILDLRIGYGEQGNPPSEYHPPARYGRPSDVESY